MDNLHISTLAEDFTTLESTIINFIDETLPIIVDFIPADDKSIHRDIKAFCDITDLCIRRFHSRVDGLDTMPID